MVAGAADFAGLEGNENCINIINILTRGPVAPVSGVLEAVKKNCFFLSGPFGLLDQVGEHFGVLFVVANALLAGEVLPLAEPVGEGEQGDTSTVMAKDVTEVVVGDCGTIFLASFKQEVPLPGCVVICGLATLQGQDELLLGGSGVLQVAALLYSLRAVKGRNVVIDVSHGYVRRLGKGRQPPFL